mmetsp:Transcript_870/g.1754  ORF Transcript_870/g.1754 Transcript_870/m.1754 type:complete len:278 (-) Transcript_870:43-876(-)
MHSWPNTDMHRSASTCATCSSSVASHISCSSTTCLPQRRHRAPRMAAKPSCTQRRCRARPSRRGRRRPSAPAASSRSLSSCSRGCSTCRRCGATPTDPRQMTISTQMTRRRFGRKVSFSRSTSTRSSLSSRPRCCPSHARYPQARSTRSRRRLAKRRARKATWPPQGNRPACMRARRGMRASRRRRRRAARANRATSALRLSSLPRAPSGTVSTSGCSRPLSPQTEGTQARACCCPSGSRRQASCSSSRTSCRCTASSRRCFKSRPSTASPRRTRSS